jgi:hypothetical protein
MYCYSNLIDILTIISSVATLIALYFTIKQNKIAQLALKETRVSIDREETNRQISLLPKFEYIIEVRTELEAWKRNLNELTEELLASLKTKKLIELKKTSTYNIKNPTDLRLSKYQYDNMPDWLSQLWLSGAQYYYSGLGSIDFLGEDKNYKDSLAHSLIERANDSSQSIEELLNYISDMVPEVILNTPASVQNREFFRRE